MASFPSEKVMEFQDRALHCIDCRQEFIFTAGEQEFYERKGFKEIPKRCKPCREQRKMRRADESAPNGNHAAPGNGHAPAAYGAMGARPPREMFDAVCASCGAQARVPFRPAAGRPVYCRDCYTARQGQGSSI
jgi:CxxC-x17-CxxC domain-containing protein